MSEKDNKTLPPQKQERQPGRESKMSPLPNFENTSHIGTGKLEGKVALITGGDSGIGRAVAVLYAKEGADIAIVYLEETEDAKKTKHEVESEGRRCLLISGDIRDESFCKESVDQTIKNLGKLDILVNNAVEQHPQDSITKITSDQLERTFQTNIFSFFYIVKASVNHLKEGGVIINTTSVTAYKGSPHLLDYSATKGSIVSFTRSLSLNLSDKKIRVNGVAPGPIWTPLIPSTFSEEHVETFGADTPMKRPGQPEEVAPCYLFLASDDSSYMSGQILHPNGGTIVNG